MKKIVPALFLLTLLSSQSALADQPIMNMMPRWDQGYGWQVISETINRDSLLDGKKSLGPGLYEDIHKLHLEGVYTWDKSIRMTIKVPYIVDAQRTVLDSTGNIVKQQTSGLGDIKLALPLKKYFNEDGYSGNWSLTPSLTLPTGEKDNSDFTLPDREWALGLGVSYEVESYQFFFATGASLTHVFGDEPLELSSHIDIGRNFAERGQFLIETDFHFEDDGTHFFSSGPALYWRFSDTVHTRIEWKKTFAETRGTIDHGDSTTFKVGAGWVF